MIAWAPPTTIATAASGAPTAVVTAAGEMAVLIPDVNANTLADLVLTVRVDSSGVVGHNVIARRGFSMINGLAAAAGDKVIVAGMYHRKSRERGAVLIGDPGGRLRLLAHLPGTYSHAFKSTPPAGPPPLPIAFFPAGGTPDASSLAGIAVPTAIAGNAAGDVAVLLSRRAAHGDRFDRGLELWVRHADGRTARHKLSPPGHSLTATAVTIDSRGRVLAAWKRATTVYARVISSASAATPTRSVGASGGFGALTVAFPSSRHAIVAWGDQPYGFDGPEGPLETFVAAEQPDKTFMSPIRLGSAPAPSGSQGVGLAVNTRPDASVAFAWTGGSSSDVVSTATLMTDNVLLRGPDASPGDLAAMTIDDRGNEVILADAGSTLTAAARPAGAQSYYAPTKLDDTAPYDAGLVPLGGRVLALWRAFTKPVKLAAGIFTP